MQSGSTKFWTWFLTGILVVGIVVAVNLFLHVFKAQVDLTEDNRFTLPAAAERIASSLEDTCVITVYLSDPLPGQYQFIGRVLKTRLEEFRDASGDKIEFSFVDPAEFDEAEQSALADKEITNIPIQASEEGKVTTARYYMTLQMTYGTEEEKFNIAQLGAQVLNAGEAEFTRIIPYIVASRLVKMQNPNQEIGIASEMKVAPQQLQQLFGKEPTDGLKGFRQAIANHITEPKDVNLKAGNPVPDTVDSLIVWRPDGLDERAVYEIDQALMRGKNVAIFLDNYASIDIDRFLDDFLQPVGRGRQASFKARKLEHSLKPWLAHFGIELGEGFVESEQCEVGSKPGLVNFGGRMITAQVATKIPGIPVAIEKEREPGKVEEFSKDNPALTGLGAMCMPWPVPLSFDAEALKEKQNGQVKGEIVVQTDENSYVRKPEGNMIQWRYDEPNIPTDRKSYPLVISLRGKFRSFFADYSEGEGDAALDRPARKGPDGSPLAELPTAAAKLTESESTNGQLWIFADADCVTDLAMHPRAGMAAAFGMGAQPGRGQNFARTLNGAVNVVDVMTIGGDLVEIRKPNLADRTMDKEAMEEDRSDIKFWAVWMAPLALIAFGLIWWILRMIMTSVPAPKRTTGPRPSLVSAAGNSSEGSQS